MLNVDYQCCYCDGGVAKDDSGAVRIVVSSLWVSGSGAVQEVFAHPQCAADKFGGTLSSTVPFDIEAFAPD
jgi:hypothetical protein